MTFVQIEKRNGMINLDGYSRNKTLKGALKDLAREVAKLDEGEANAITNNLDETVQMVAEGMDNYPGCYVIEAEEVGCASRYKYLDGDENNYSEENVEIEHAEGHWYLYIRFVAPEQDSETSAAEKAAEVGTQNIEQIAETAIENAEITVESENEVTARYEIKRFGNDPFDMMCSDCPVHEIWWWEGATLEELHNIHDEQVAMDETIPEWAIHEWQDQGDEWKPTNPDFDAWLKESIAEGYIREVA